MISLSWFDGRGAIVLAAFHQCALWTKSALEAAIFEQYLSHFQNEDSNFTAFETNFVQCISLISLPTYVDQKNIYFHEKKKISHTNSIFAKFDKYLWIFSAFLEIW